MSVSKINKMDEKQRENKGMTYGGIFTNEDMENISLVSWITSCLFFGITLMSM